MGSATPWLGTKRVAFVPLFRTRAAPPDQIPPDWENLILKRVVYDPRSEAKGADRSLRAWVRAASSGLADIDPLVLPMRSIDRQDVPAVALEGALGAQLRDQGMHAAMLVMLGGRPSGTNSGFWSRVVMAESNGVWLMELIHGLTGFWDLYHFNNDAETDPIERAIDTFDQMSAASQTHPTAFTKNELGWLDTSAIARHTGRSAVLYDLQHIGLAQPPAAGRAAAVRIGDSVPYVMIEARTKTDQFEAGMPSTGDVQERGIASEGVIAYRVQTRDPTAPEREGHKKPLFLLTLTALKTGESASIDDHVVTVSSGIPGGFAIRVDQPVPWSSVSEGSSTPGAPITAVVTGPNRQTLFLADRGGGVFTTSGSAESGWAPWSSVSEGATRPGAPIGAVFTGPNRTALFLADPNGGVFTTIGGAEAGWRPWSSVSEGSSTPGAPVTVVLTGNRLAVFLADPGGGVFATSGSVDAGWRPWSSVSEGGTTPGGRVTAVATGQNRVALFLADPGGGVFATSGSVEAGWRGWSSVSEGATRPGAPITAVVIGPNRLALFLTDPNGGVFTTVGSVETGWGPWASVSEGSSTPGAAVAAVVTGPNRIELFIADRNGGVFTTSGHPDTGWGPWTSVAEGKTTPGGHVTAVSTGQNGVALFLADPNGGVFTSIKNL